MCIIITYNLGVGLLQELLEVDAGEAAREAGNQHLAIYTCTCVDISIYIYIHTYTHIYIHVCIYIYIYTYI